MAQVQQTYYICTCQTVDKRLEKDFSSHLNFLWDRTCKICLIMIFIVTCIKKKPIYFLSNQQQNLEDEHVYFAT